MPGLGSLDMVAAPSTTVSPIPRRTAPPACRATRPASRLRVLPPTSNVCVCINGCLLSRPDFANAEFLHQGAVLYHVLVAQITFQPPALADEQREPSPRMEILFVGSQVIRNLCDAGLHDRDLHFGGTCVPLLSRVIGDHRC